MPMFRVTKGHDAFVYYEKDFEADTFGEAIEMADADRYGDGWVAAGHFTEYDDATVLEDQSERLADDDTTLVGAGEPVWLRQEERDIIIAALRHWQDANDIPPAILEIARNDRGTFLDDNAIDELIEEKINV